MCLSFLIKWLAAGRQAAAALTGLALLLLSMPAVAQEGTLLVTNRQGGSISFFDMKSETEVARLPIGPVIPHEVAVSPNGRWALTGEYGPGDNPGHRLVIMDVANTRIAGRIDLGAQSRPHSMAFLSDNRRAVATMQASNRLALVDIVRQKVLRTFPTGGHDGHMVRLSPDGSRAYVTNRGAEGTLSVIFLEEDREPVVVPTGAGAEGLAVSPDGQEVWVANRNERTISVVDTNSFDVVETLPAHPLSGRIAFSDGGKVAVVNGRSSERVVQYLRIFDAESRKIEADIPLRDGQPARGNFGLLVHGDRIFATDVVDGRLLRYRFAAPKDPRVLATDHESPDGMAWSPVCVVPFC